MNFWENYYKICKSIGKSPNKVAEDLKIASGTVSAWKKGSPPNSERLVAIADYFGVSTDYLLGRSGADPELPEDERRLLDNYRKASEEGKKIIQKTAEGAADLDPNVKTAETA